MATRQVMAATMTNPVEVVAEGYLFGTEDLMASRRFPSEQWRMRWSTNISELSNAHTSDAPTSPPSTPMMPQCRAWSRPCGSADATRGRSAGRRSSQDPMVIMKKDAQLTALVVLARAKCQDGQTSWGA